MATITRFEDLEVWKLARAQCNEVFDLIRSGAFKEDGDLRSQMNRSSASVMDTIGEGFERFTTADFRHFLVIAKGSNGEVRSQLHRMWDRAFIPEALHQRLVAANTMLGNKLYTFINIYPTVSIRIRGVIREIHPMQRNRE